MHASSSAGGRVVMVGCFPPPVFGPSVFNDSMRQILEEHAADVVILNIAPKLLGSSLLQRGWRLWRTVQALVRFVTDGWRRPFSGAYIQLSSDIGLMLEIPFMLLARLRGIPLYLHYHGYGLVRQGRRITTLVVNAAGPDATHVVLCEAMRNDLRSRFPKATHTMVVGGAATQPIDALAVSPKVRLDRVGFLSNISIEKGIRDFLEVVEELYRRGCPVRAEVGGPFLHNDLRTEVTGRLQAVGGRYLGPVYGAAKGEFWRSIDVLVFPSQWRHEADPITVHEALGSGVPVVAKARGCIPGVLGAEAGIVIDESEFVPRTVAQLEWWASEPAALRAASESALSRANGLRTKQARNVAALVEALCGISRSDPEAH